MLLASNSIIDTLYTLVYLLSFYTVLFFVYNNILFVFTDLYKQSKGQINMFHELHFFFTLSLVISASGCDVYLFHRSTGEVDKIFRKHDHHVLAVTINKTNPLQVHFCQFHDNNWFTLIVWFFRFVLVRHQFFFN